MCFSSLIGRLNRLLAGKELKRDKPGKDIAGCLSVAAQFPIGIIF